MSVSSVSHPCSSHVVPSPRMPPRWAKQLKENAKRLINVCSNPSSRVQEVAELLKDKGLDVNACDMWGKTALISASIQGSYPIVTRLLKCPDIEVNTEDVYGRTALISASCYATQSVVAELLQMTGIEVNARDQWGNTALSIATRYGNYEIVIELLKVPHLDVNLQDTEGNTPLMVSFFHGSNHLVIEALLTSQAVRSKIYVENRRGETALMVAKRKEYDPAILQKLEEVEQARSSGVGNEVTAKIDIEGIVEIIMGYFGRS